MTQPKASKTLEICLDYGDANRQICNRMNVKSLTASLSGFKRRSR